jgi:hypothetical protein
LSWEGVEPPPPPAARSKSLEEAGPDPVHTNDPPPPAPWKNDAPTPPTSTVSVVPGDTLKTPCINVPSPPACTHGGVLPRAVPPPAAPTAVIVTELTPSGTVKVCNPPVAVNVCDVVAAAFANGIHNDTAATRTPPVTPAATRGTSPHITRRVEPLLAISTRVFVCKNRITVRSSRSDRTTEFG